MKPAEENFEMMVLDKSHEIYWPFMDNRKIAPVDICEAFKAGVAFARQNLVHIPEVKEAIEILKARMQKIKIKHGEDNAAFVKIKEALRKLGIAE